jgi:hypothetical protein
VQLPGFLVHRQHREPGRPQFLSEAAHPRTHPRDGRCVPRGVLRFRWAGRIVCPVTGEAGRAGIAGHGLAGCAGQDRRTGWAAPARRFRWVGQFLPRG